MLFYRVTIILTNVLNRWFSVFCQRAWRRAVYYFVDVLAGSQARYNADYGAMLITADDRQIIFEFISRSGELIDSFQMQK